MLRNIILTLLFIVSLYGQEQYNDFPDGYEAGDITIEMIGSTSVAITFYDMQANEQNSYVLFMKQYDESGNLLGFTHIDSKKRKFYVNVENENFYEFMIGVQDSNGMIISHSPLEKFRTSDFAGFSYKSFSREVNSASTMVVDTKQFPYIGVEFSYDRNITLDNITLKEDTTTIDKAQIYQFQQVKSQNITPKQQLEIVFLIDISASMKEDFDTVKQNISMFISSITTKGFDYSLALVSYGDKNKAYEIMTDLDTNQTFMTQLNSLDKSQFEGSVEKAYDAIVGAVNKISWHDGSKKIFIMITDENSDSTSITLQNAIESIKSKDITFYGLTKGHKEFKDLADATGGKVYYITSTYNDIIQQPKQDYLYTYTFYYNTPNHTGQDQRTVTLNLSSKTLTAKYTPPQQLLFGLKLVDVVEEAREYVSIDIKAEVINNESIKDLVLELYYRHGSTGGFEKLKMKKNSSGIYKATIPQYKVVKGNIDYYIVGSTDKASLSLYKNSNLKTPFSISVANNEKPIIQHSKVVSLEANKPLIIQGQIFDVSQKIDEVYVNYCLKECNKWRNWTTLLYVKPMATKYTLNTTLPASKITTNEIKYYIRAKDNYGAKSYVGDYSHPVVVHVNNTTSTSNDSSETLSNTCKTINKVTVCATGFNGGSSSWQTKGSVFIKKAGSKSKKIIKLENGYISYTNQSNLYGQGKLTVLNIKGNSNASPRNMFVYEGPFNLDSTQPAINAGSMLYILYNVNCKIDDKAITINKPSFILPKQQRKFLNTAVTFSDIKLDQDGNSQASITAAIDKKIKLGKSFEVSDLKFSYDILKTELGGEGKFSFGTLASKSTAATAKLKFWLQPTFGLNEIEVGLERDLLDIPPTTPVFATLNSVKLNINNMIAKKDALKLVGTAGCKFNDRFQIIKGIESVFNKKVLSGEVTVTIVLDGSFELAGKVDLFEKVTLANAKIGRSKTKSKDKLYLEGGIDFIIVEGVLKTSIFGTKKLVEFNGNAYLQVIIPKQIRVIGGKTLAKQQYSAIARFKKTGDKFFQFNAQSKFLWIKYNLSLKVKFEKNQTKVIVSAGGMKVSRTYSVQRSINRNVSYEDLTQTLHIDKNYEFVLIRVIANKDGQTAQMDLKYPDGTLYHSKDVDIDSVDINTLAQGNIFYRKNENINEAYFSLKTPAVGDYKLNILNEDHLDGYKVEIIIPNKKPSFAFTMPSTDIYAKNSETLSIGWNDNDEDDDANITLYYDDDKEGFDGIPISEVISEDDENDSYTWEIPEDIDSGRYYLYARIDDGSNAPLYVYSDYFIDITNDKAPNAPQNIKVTPQDGSLLVEWDDINDADLLSYRVYLSEDDNSSDYPYSFAVGTQTSYEIKDLANNHNYKIALKAINKALYQSPYSSSIVAAPNGTASGGNPDLTFGDMNASSVSQNLEGNVQLNIEVKNIGRYSSYFAEVKCYYGELNNLTFVGSEILGSIEPSKSQTVTFNVDMDTLKTMRLNDKRRFFVFIENTKLQELNTNNNSSSFTIDLTIKEDINKDFKIDIVDIMQVAAKYHKENFSSHLDITKDNIIDEDDIEGIAKKWGE